MKKPLGQTTGHNTRRELHDLVEPVIDTDRTYAYRAATTARILFDKKWKVHLLCAMRSGSVRLGQLGRRIPGASKKVITQHLRELEADGIVIRTDKSDVVLHVEYELASDSRAEILLILDQLAGFGKRHTDR